LSEATLLLNFRCILSFEFRDLDSTQSFAVFALRRRLTGNNHCLVGWRCDLGYCAVSCRVGSMFDHTVR